jgi:hypothetical protein
LCLVRGPDFPRSAVRFPLAEAPASRSGRIWGALASSRAREQGRRRAFSDLSSRRIRAAQSWYTKSWYAYLSVLSVPYQLGGTRRGHRLIAFNLGPVSAKVRTPLYQECESSPDLSRAPSRAGGGKDARLPLYYKEIPTPAGKGFYSRRENHSRRQRFVHS